MKIWTVTYNDDGSNPYSIVLLKEADADVAARLWIDSYKDDFKHLLEVESDWDTCRGAKCTNGCARRAGFSIPSSWKRTRSTTASCGTRWLWKMSEKTFCDRIREQIERERAGVWGNRGLVIQMHPAAHQRYKKEASTDHSTTPYTSFEGIPIEVDARFDGWDVVRK